MAMTGRTSRTRNIPARLREETWYLVEYEDDENLRVVHEKEIRHIFSEDEEDEIQPGDIVSAIWTPNGQYYDAKVLKVGVDKNELMKERVRLEKVKKCDKRPNSDATVPQPSQKKKRKHPGYSAGDQDKEKRLKEKDDKKKKKEEEKQRQALLVETRKAQAEARWASNTQSFCNSPQGQEVMVAADVHVPAVPRSAESTSLLPSADTDHSNHKDRSKQANTAHRTPQSNNHQVIMLSAARSQSIQRTRVSSHSNLSPVSSNMCTPQTNTSLQSNRQTPVLIQTPENSFTPSSRNSNNNELRRSLHFDSARQVAEVSSDEEDTSPDDPVDDDHGHENQCCRDQWLENKALRNRLQKLHRRLNIALKAKTSGEIEANRPSPGILDQTLAQEYKMVELIEGSGVFWYPHQRAYCSAYKGWTGYLNAAVDIFFSKDTLKDSCAKGQEHKSKNGSGRQALSPLIVEALIGKVCSKFSKEGPTPSQVVQKINMKCVEARRPPRVRVLQIQNSPSSEEL